MAVRFTILIVGVGGVLIAGLIMIPTTMAALGTILVAIVAVWGSWLRSRLAGPVMELELENPGGDIARTGEEQMYYRVVVRNKRSWSAAKGVRVFCTGIAKRVIDGSFEKERLLPLLQLTWSHPEVHDIAYPELNPDIGLEQVCDLGVLFKERKVFFLCIYGRANVAPDFGVIKPGEALRISLGVSADNFTTKRPYVVEIDWDGQWSDDTKEMCEHLVVTELQKLNS